MDSNNHAQITELLKSYSDGNEGARDSVLLVLYEELRGMASQKMRRENIGHTLQPTAIVHELWAKLAKAEQVPFWPSRGHFFKWASKAMGSYLLDHARHKNSQKAGGNAVRITLGGMNLHQAPTKIPP